MPNFTAVASSTFTTDENPISEGGVWTVATQPTGAVKKLGGVAVPTSASDAYAFYSGLSFNNDQYSKGDLTTTNGAGNGAGSGLILRRTAAATNTNFVFFIDHAATNNAAVFRVVTGTYTQRGSSWTQAFTNGDTFYFAVAGLVLYVFDKNVNQVYTFDDTGGGGPASGKPGIGFSSTFTSPNVDNWEGGNFSIATVAQLVPAFTQQAGSWGVQYV